MIAPEHPGFGASDDPPWLDRPSDLAYFYLDVIDALQLARGKSKGELSRDDLRSPGVLAREAGTGASAPAIAAVARSEGLVTVEDMTYTPLLPRTPRPMAAFSSENSYSVMTISKAVSPVFRLAYLMAPGAAAVESVGRCLRGGRRGRRFGLSLRLRFSGRISMRHIVQDAGNGEVRVDGQGLIHPDDGLGLAHVAEQRSQHQAGHRRHREGLARVTRPQTGAATKLWMRARRRRCPLGPP